MRPSHRVRRKAFMRARNVQRSAVGFSLAMMFALATGHTQAPQASRPSAAVKGAAPASTAIVPFSVHVPDAVLADLKQRLSRARFPDELTGSGWTYGTNLAYLRDLVAYWRDTFDWRAQERRLNQFEQFKTNIDGLDIHFIHRRSKEPNEIGRASCRERV